MRSVMLIGRVGADASVEKSKNGNEFIKFSLATQEYNEKEPVWMNVLSFNHEIIKMASYYKKGSLLSVMGDLKVNKFVNKENIPVTNLDVMAFSCSFVNVGNRENNNGNQQTSSTQDDKPKSVESEITPEQMVASMAQVSNKVSELSNVETDDADDLPF